MKSLKDKVILITGASSGIGLAAARLFHSDGAKLVLAARNRSRLEPVAEELSGSVAVQTDVTQAESAAGLARTALDRFGRIDVLVNSAGILLYKKASECTDEENRALLETNYFGAVRCVNAVLPAMRRQRAGHIVNLSSVAGCMGLPRLAYYGASKFALRGYSHALRQELREEGIGVSVVCPGTVDTPMAGEILEEAARNGRRIFPVPAGAVAETIRSSILNNRAETVLPLPVRVLSWIHFFAPWAAEAIAERFRSGGRR
jgi:short-subunit dehydrogenase